MQILLLLAVLLGIYKYQVLCNPASSNLSPAAVASSSNSVNNSIRPPQPKVPDFLRSWKTNPSLSSVSKFWEIEKGKSESTWNKGLRHVQLKWTGNDKLKLKSRPFLNEFNQQLEIEIENLYTSGYLSVEVKLFNNKIHWETSHKTLTYHQGNSEIVTVQFSHVTRQQPCHITVEFKHFEETPATVPTNENNENEDEDNNPTSASSDVNSPLLAEAPEAVALVTPTVVLRVLDMRMADNCYNNNRCQNGATCIATAAFKSMCECHGLFTGIYCQG